MSLQTVTAAPDTYVTMNMTLDRVPVGNANPPHSDGLAGTNGYIVWDPTYLTLISMSAEGAVLGNWEPPTVTQGNTPFTFLNWGNGLYNTPNTGQLLAITFRVADNAPLGAIPVSLNVASAVSVFPTIDWTTTGQFSQTDGAVIVETSDLATVAVGTQVGTMTAGVTGTVTFPVTTANIANGDYTVSVANLPAGVTVQGQVTINNNSGTLTLAGDTTTLIGSTNNLTLTLNDATSAAFTLTIEEVSQPAFVWGDVSGDEHVTMEDVDLILMYLAGFITADDLDLRAAKVAGNPTVTMVDVDMILMYLAGFINTLDPNA
jgi:hypothetical protein